jgi:cardiolipin synthase
LPSSSSPRITDYLDGYLARAWQQTSNIGRMLDPIADKLLVATCLLLLAADTDRTIAGWSLWAAIIILCREILVSGLREYLADAEGQRAGDAAGQMEDGDPDGGHRRAAGRPCAATRSSPYATETGIILLWIAAIVTLYTGYDYFRAGLKHIVDE